jgi:hypothetical protein
MKILSTTLHGALDYCVAIAMICTPFLLQQNLSLATTLILVAGGLAVLINALATNYEFGMFRNISMVNHLRIDALIALMICLLPILFPFDHYSIPLIYGTALFILSIITNRTPFYKMFHQFTYRKFEKFPTYRY